MLFTLRSPALFRSQFWLLYKKSFPDLLLFIFHTAFLTKYNAELNIAHLLVTHNVGHSIINRFSLL